MLKKIFLTGRLILSPKQKEKNNELDFDKPFKSSAYYSLLVKISNGSVTLLRCVVRSERKKEWTDELNDGDIVKIWGTIKNELKSRQIIVDVSKWEKIDSTFEELDEEKCDFVKLAGEVVDIRESNEDKTDGEKPKVLSLKVLCSFQGSFDKSNIFFCRINENNELISSMNIKKGDVIVAIGFLQTKKIASLDATKIEDRISAIICQKIWIIDNMDETNWENQPSDIKVYNMKVNKIDFTRPKPNEY